MNKEYLYLTWLAKGLDGFCNLVFLYLQQFGAAPKATVEHMITTVDKLREFLNLIKKV